MMFFLTLFNTLLLSFATCPMNSYTCTVSSTTYTACNSNRFLVDGKICADSCPSLFTAGTNSCTSTNNNCLTPSSALLRLQFKTVQDLTLTSIASTIDTSELFQNLGGISYNDPSQNSPLPTLDRGFYFATSSSITSNKSHIPSLYFNLKLWIKPLSPTGQILVVSYNSKNYIRCSFSNPNQPKLEVIVQSATGETTISVVSSSSASQNWQNMVFRINQSSCSSLDAIVYINMASTGSTTFNNVEASFPNSNSYTWTIGKGGGNDSFRGFLAIVEIRYDGNVAFGVSPITVECYDNQFSNGSTCENCPANCPVWPWCTTSTTCSVCSITDCSSCKAYSSTICLGCFTGVLPNCCDFLATSCTQTWTNTACGTGYFLIGGVCLYACPYGFGNCASVSSAVISADFMTAFAGDYDAFITGTSSSSYNFWNSPEGYDPIPAKNRGLYFNGSAFLSGYIDLSHTWSIGMWVYAISGTIIGHSTDKLSLSSTGSLLFDLQKWDGSYASYSNSQSMSNNEWNYVSYSIGFASKTSTITPYLNNVAETATSVIDYIFRLSAGGILYIGKGSGSYFTGFLSYFQLWGVTITSFTSAYNLYGFSGSVVNTLWPCTFNQYYDGTACQSCLGTCSNGCARSSSCIICVNDICTKCSYFTAGTCYECVPNASGTTCACNSDSVLSADGLSCILCPNGCSRCTVATYQKCIECYAGFYFFASTEQCLNECPSGYSANSSTKSCDYVSDLALSLDLTDQILLNAVSGFNVGSSNTNNYPDWSDTYDPIPAYKRGYYFNQNNYLSSTVMIAPIFTVSLWAKPYSGGILMTKYATSDILKLTINSSGQPTLSITTDDASVYTLYVAINILDHWNFLSFTGEVQADGKTKFTIYLNTGVSNSLTTPSLTYFNDTHSGTLYVGNDESFGNSGLYGFLARLMIYNSFSHLADDYATSSCIGCAVCPSNNQCLSKCGPNDYPDSCSACLTGCNKGCASNLACTLCRDKECYSCTSFSGECTACIANAYKLADHCVCLPNAVWVASSQSCELCDSACVTCSAPKYTGCDVCTSGSYLIQSLCNTFCPIGYVINGSNCDSDPGYTDSFVFNLKPHQIKDIVTDLISNIQVLTGKDNKFYPDYDSTDPFAAIYRGYYFTGLSYMQLPPYPGTTSPLLTLAPKFVISAWIKPVLDTGIIFTKQTDNGSYQKYVSLELINQFPSLTLTLKNSFTVTYTSTILSLKVTLSNWNFISATSDISATPQQIVSLTINTNTDTSSDLHTSWFNDLQSSFYITIGATYLSSTTLTSFFNGFLWDLKIYNTPTVISLAETTCNGCSLCPIDNANTCLDSCLIDSYWNGVSCGSCLPECSNKGCVRNDKSCNLCQDIICEICDDYASACITCKTNASLVSSSCQCNLGYYWDSSNESCGLCDASCKTCTSFTYLDCLICADGLAKVSGVCLSSCPLGYIKSANECVLTQEKIFDLDLNTLKGLVYDKASSIPVVTGSTKQFYPDYEADDPIPAYLRGFYFNGKSSVLRLPEYSNYISPRLAISFTFTISIWLNTETSDSALMSKHYISGAYPTLYLISLTDKKPKISLPISSSQFFHVAQKSLSYYEWSHIAFTLETTLSGNNLLSSYINGVFDSSKVTNYGFFSDIGPHTTISIGAEINSSAAYNFYQGFIYTIQVYNAIKPISTFSTIYCTESCSVCPSSQICIPNCKINEYWRGPDYNICNQCSINCQKTCRRSSACSLCDSLLCDACDDYPASSCSACKESAVNPNSCMCDEGYVLDSSTNSTCISIPIGGFRGDDGVFYPCPKLCTICQSSTKCTACIENGVLINDLCYCDIGYNGTVACALVPFSARLAVLSDNSLYLIFSDSLVNNIEKNDITISIEKHGKMPWKIEQVNTTCYYITLNIDEEISKGSLVTLEFLNLTELRSVSNGILNTSHISGQLNYYDPAPLSSPIATASSNAKVGAQTAISIVAVLSFINSSPSSLWSIINYIQILSYLTLSGIPLSSTISAFLNNLNNFNLFPNIFPYFIDENEGNTPYNQAQEFGYNSDLILITTGNDFTLILASISVLPAIYFFSNCSHRWLGKKFKKTLKAYQFSFYLRFWVQCYLELGAAASIGLVTFGFSNATQTTNIIICAFIYILLGITPPALFWFSYQNKNRIQSREKTFAALYNSLFYEFRTNRGFLATQYYFVFFLRRIIYIINLVYLRDFPQTEVTINIVLSLMSIMHLWFFWPYEDPISQVSNLLTEILICLVMAETSVYLFTIEQKIVSMIENSIVAIVIAAIAIQSLASIAIFIRALIEIIRKTIENPGYKYKDSCKPKLDSKVSKNSLRILN